MAIYRAEQVKFGFTAEAGRGGTPELATATDLASSPAVGAINLTAGYPAGTRTMVVDGASPQNFTAGDYVRIETATAANREVRKLSKASATSLTFDTPTGFPHANNAAITELTPGTLGTNPSITGLAGTSFATFIPGVYETITTPDLTPEFLPQYFLSSTANRNWSRMYRGRQTFTGGVPSFMLLNGSPLRFPIGKVATTGTDQSSSGGGGTLNGATLKGATTIIVSAATNYATGDFIQIGTGTSAEVRQIVTIASTTFTLNYPLMQAHATGVALNEVTGPYTHTIVETSQLDTVTWNVSQRDSGETAANDFNRRYYGGTVGRGTLAAEEGAMLRFSWDEVQFLGLLHNEATSTGVTGEIPMSSRSMIQPTGHGGSIPHSSNTYGTATFPTNQPYYFSQGSISLFGEEFARIRTFSLDINNQLEARYYLRDEGAERGPNEIQEQRREYAMTATVALPDSAASTSTARSLWKELILEGKYDAAMSGFDVSLVFTRGTNDTITITAPSSSAADGLETQGAFLRGAPHVIGTDNPLQADLDIMFRNMSIVVVDSEGVYP